MALCPTCNTEFTAGEQFCPRDGTPLQGQSGGDRLLGRVLSGRYRLEERLGQGGMGAVYRAHHLLMDKPVAVKVLRQELSSDAEAVARFHREARSASRLDHEHIIRVTDFGQSDDGQLFLVMELLDGESLADVVRQGPLPWRRAAAIMRDVALGLGHAHEQGIIHRDLKPENIILSRRPRSGRQVVKVLDFGLAKLLHEAGAGAADASITRTGVVFGTPEYMSPEQAEGRPLDHRTDLYSLGVIGYQMLTGDVPFSASTFLALITRTVMEPPEPPSRRCPGLELPPELEALVLRCLEKQPSARPQTADELVAALEPLLGSHTAVSVPLSSAPGSGGLASGAAALAPTRDTPPSSGPHAPTPSTEPAPTSPPEEEQNLAPRRRRWPLYAAALALLAAGGTVGPRLLRRPPALTPQPAQRDPLTTAHELLLGRRIDDALAILQMERERRNTPAIQRLLSEAYEAKDNRLRALGHMYLALRLSGQGPEEARTRLSLAQLLSRMGHAGESCRVAADLTSPSMPESLRQQAESLVRTLRCEAPQ